MPDCLTLIELRRLLSTNQAEMESRVAKGHGGQKRVHAAEEDLEAFCTARMKVVRLTEERATLTADTEQAKAESDTLDIPISKLEVSAATCDEQLGNLVRVFKLLESFVALEGYMANIIEAQACETVEKRSELRVIVERLN